MSERILTYTESDGTQYIDTGVNPSARTQKSSGSVRSPKKLSRKRFIKLIMANGISRNRARAAWECMRNYNNVVDSRNHEQKQCGGLYRERRHSLAYCACECFNVWR